MGGRPGRLAGTGGHGSRSPPGGCPHLYLSPRRPQLPRRARARPRAPPPPPLPPAPRLAHPPLSARGAGPPRQNSGRKLPLLHSEVADESRGPTPQATPFPVGISPPSELDG